MGLMFWRAIPPEINVPDLTETRYDPEEHSIGGAMPPEINVLYLTATPYIQ